MFPELANDCSKRQHKPWQVAVARSTIAYFNLKGIQLVQNEPADSAGVLGEFNHHQPETRPY